MWLRCEMCNITALHLSNVLSDSAFDMNANNALKNVKILFALKMESQIPGSHTYSKTALWATIWFCATQIWSKTMWWLTWKILFHWDSASKVSTWWARQSDWRMQDGALGWTAPSLAPHLPRPWLRWGFLHGRLCQDCGRRKRTYSGHQKSKTYKGTRMPHTNNPKRSGLD